MKSKRYNLFNYLSTWKGILQIAVGLYSFYWVYRIVFQTNESLVFKVILSVICAGCGILVTLVGSEGIKNGISLAKEQSSDYIYGRERR